MSEQKRVNFQTISSTTAGAATFAATSSSSMSSMRFGYNMFGDGGAATAGNNESAPGNTSQDTKNGIDKTFRLKLKLFQTDSSSYPEFNYSKLLHLEKKKIKKLKQKTNGFGDPFGTNDDDVERIAKELEKKYSGAYGGGGRSRNRKDDKSDLGLGYDISDSFIDNTEAYDEILPEEMEAKEGGFYINSGALVFKNLYNEPAKTKTDEIIKMPNRPKKRVISSSSEESSSDDDDNDNNDDNNEANNDENDTGEDAAADGSSKSKTIHKEKRVKQDTTVAKKPQDNEKKRDKKGSQSCSSSNSPKPSMEEVCSDSDKDRMRQKTVKTTTVKDMLKAKRDNFLKMQEGGDTKNVNGELKGVASKSSDDESTDDDSEDADDNSDSNQSVPTQTKDVKKTANNEDGTEKLRSSDTKLPELDNEIAISIQEFKDMAKSKSLIGKRFQFDDHLTDVFLKIDESLLCIERPQRNMVFAHLEYELLLPKYYFLRKAKQLRIKEEKLKSKRALGKLRKAVIETMPGAIAGYEVELRKATESQSGNLNSEQLQKMPKKKFPWNSNLRNLLYDVYQVRWTSYPVLRTRKETLEDFINIFMRDKVVELWPSGWMRYEDLQKEIERRKTAAKKAKEKKKHGINPAINSVTIATGAVVNATAAGAIGTSTTDSPFIKQEESVSSGRSCANSDTDSVASSGNSGALKRKAVDSSQKQSKTKTQKTNNDKLQSTECGMNAAISLDTTSPTKRTDHSIHNIMSASVTAAMIAASTVTPTTSASTTSITSISNSVSSGSGTSTHGQHETQIKHSSTMARPYAHVIDLDKYKSTNDILQTSKQILHTTSGTTTVVGGVGGISGTTATTASYSNIIDNSNIRRSSSDSDGVEIVGVFQAEPIPTAAILSKQKHKRNGSQNIRSATPITNTNHFQLDAQANLFNTQASSSSAATIMKKSPTASNNNNNNNNSNTNNNHKRSAMTMNINSGIGGAVTNSNIGASLANFDAAKVVNVLKELEIPQSVSTKQNNQ